MNDEITLGIDYGTSTTLIGWARQEVRDATPGASEPRILEIGFILDPIAFGEARTLVLSAIAWPRDPSVGPPLIGRAAEECRDGRYVILRSLKRCLRCTKNKAIGEGTCFNPQNFDLCDGLGQYDLGGRWYHTSQLIEAYFAQVIERLKDCSTLPISFDQPQLIRLGVPGDFGPDLRSRMAETLGAVAVAASPQGRDIRLEILEEPTAALRFIYSPYSRFLGKLRPGLHVVMDVGGGSTDIAILSLDPERNVMLVLSPTATPKAGDDFDEALYRYYGGRVRRPSVYETREYLRAVKHAFSEGREIARFPLSEVEEVLMPVAEEIRNFLFGEIEKMIKDYETIGFPEIPEVVTIYLIGGGSRLPLIERAIREDPRYEEVGSPDVLRLEESRGVNALHAVALGLTIIESRIHPVSLRWLPGTVLMVFRDKEVKQFDHETTLPTNWVLLELDRSSIDELSIEHNWEGRNGELLEECFHVTRKELSPRKWLHRKLYMRSERVHFRLNAYGELEIHIGWDPQELSPYDQSIRWRFNLPWRSRFVEQLKKHEINLLRRKRGLPPLA